MPKTERDLSEDSRKMWLKALSALELRNFGYVVQLVQTVLKETPDFLQGRQVLRRAEIEITKGKKSFMSGLSTGGMKGASLLKKDPKAAMELAEELLEKDPYNQQGNMLLKDAAMAAGFPEVASFALETLVQGNPKDTKILNLLGDHYYQVGQHEKAVDVYTRITELNPADLASLKKGKDAAARASMTSGKWEEVAASDGKMDYRDLIKNQEEAKSLEQKSRVVKSHDMIDQQLSELLAKYEEKDENKQSVDLVRKIASLFDLKGELDHALEWYTYISEHLTNHTDPVIERKVSETQFKILDRSIEEYQAWLDQHGNADNAPEVQKDLDNLLKQKSEMQLSEARKRVERNPTDSMLHFEFGEQLIAAGYHGEAIRELQVARKNPAVRLKAMNLLGDCYAAKNMLDFAVNTYGDACKEMVVMDDLKKEITYKLGLLHERMGDKKAYLERMKDIYDADYGYKDVARRVESSYEQE
jgi:tetratricopeptide (TPR) repeat protein